MSVSYTDIQASFAEFASTDSSLITRKIAEAQARISESVYGALYDQAVMYLTAHLLAVQASGGSGSGPVKRIKVGDLEREYATPTSASSYDGATTSYWKEFKDISSRVAKAQGPISLTC